MKNMKFLSIVMLTIGILFASTFVDAQSRGTKQKTAQRSTYSKQKAKVPRANMNRGRAMHAQCQKGHSCRSCKHHPKHRTTRSRRMHHR
jgi:hypothetical protein